MIEIIEKNGKKIVIVSCESELESAKKIAELAELEYKLLTESEIKIFYQSLLDNLTEGVKKFEIIDNFEPYFEVKPKKIYKRSSRNHYS